MVSAMNEANIVIHLAGENVFSQRWSDEVKKKIYNSRIEGTRTLVDAMREAETSQSFLFPPQLPAIMVMVEIP